MVRDLKDNIKRITSLMLVTAMVLTMDTSAFAKDVSDNEDSVVREETLDEESQADSDGNTSQELTDETTSDEKLTDEDAETGNPEYDELLFEGEDINKTESENELTNNVNLTENEVNSNEYSINSSGSVTAEDLEERLLDYETLDPAVMKYRK